MGQVMFQLHFGSQHVRFQCANRTVEHRGRFFMRQILSVRQSDGRAFGSRKKFERRFDGDAFGEESARRIHWVAVNREMG